MRRTRALGIGLFLGMIVCLFFGTTAPVLAARCIEECESEYSACGQYCPQSCNGDQACLQTCHDLCDAGYNSCMAHSVYCSTQSYCYNWTLTLTCYSRGLDGWWCYVTSRDCNGWT